MHFFKYHGLGNDYLVLDPAGLPAPLNAAMTPEWAVAICDRNRGVGGDGIVYGPLPVDGLPADHFACQIWNPDGSIAEVSGNGLRIFARYLRDACYVDVAATACTLQSGGRAVTVTYHDDGDIGVALGRATAARLPSLPVTDAAELAEAWTVDVGNPHCVFFPVETVTIDADLAHRWGPRVEVADLFPNRTNVQFVRSLNRHRLHIEIWERGAGYHWPAAVPVAPPPWPPCRRDEQIRLSPCKCRAAHCAST
ncbi:MAG: diaminopimelate epimerase [Caldilineaceae bacterium]